jgi:integrase
MEDDPRTGRRRRRSRSFASAAQATEFRNRRLGKVTDGTHTDDGNLTLGEYLGDWLRGLSLAVELGEIRPSTFVWYEGAVEGHIMPALGDLRLSKLTAAHLENFYADKLRNGRIDGTGGLSSTSVRRLSLTLRKSLADAVTKRLIPTNPSDHVRYKPQAKRNDATARVWDAAQLRRFLQVAANERLSAAFRLAAVTGMRRGEVLGLRWRDVDLEAGRIEIRETLVVVKGRAQFSKPKTDAGFRSIVVDAGTATALRAWRVSQLEERLSWREAWSDTGLLFTRQDGTLVHPEWLSQRFGRISELAGLPRIPLHGLRHSVATLAIKAGTPVKVVSELLGHSKVSTTMQIYQTVLPGMQEEAVAMLAAAIDG